MACRAMVNRFRPLVGKAASLLNKESFYAGLRSDHIVRSTPTLTRVLQSSFHTSTTHLNEHIINIQDEADFKKRVMESETPVVIDFYATWCGPCKLLIPRLETLITAKKGKVILAKIDIDALTELAVNHGVEAVPTVLAMKNGKVVDKFVGLKDDAALDSFVEKFIN